MSGTGKREDTGAPERGLGSVGGIWFLEGRKMARWSPRSRRHLQHQTPVITQELLPQIPHSCTHVRGHGGVKGALRQIHRALPRAPFVARFDIAAYYRSMRHDVIETQLAATTLGAHPRKLIAAYLALPDTRGTGRGMVAGGGLSPLLGALYLTPLDRRMETAVQRASVSSTMSATWTTSCLLARNPLAAPARHCGAP